MNCDGTLSALVHVGFSEGRVFHPVEFSPCAVYFSPCANFHPALCVFHPVEFSPCGNFHPGIFTLRCVFFILWEFSPCAVYFSSFGNFTLRCVFFILWEFSPCAVYFSPCAVYFSRCAVYFSPCGIFTLRCVFFISFKARLHSDTTVAASRTKTEAKETKKNVQNTREWQQKWETKIDRKKRTAFHDETRLNSRRFFVSIFPPPCGIFTLEFPPCTVYFSPRGNILKYS